MFIKPHVEKHVLAAFDRANDLQRAHLIVIQQVLDGRERVIAGVKPLNRYSIQPGKTFAASPDSKDKYKVLRVIADDIVLQDLRTKKIQTFQVDRLLADWAKRGIKEVSALEEIIRTVQQVLGPVLGIFLTSALISWLIDRLR